MVGLAIAGVVASVPVLVGGGFWLGHRLDERWGTGPWLAAAGAVLGFAAGALEIAIVTRKFWK